jgi:DNA repair exonuclease SbcCD ATPase subunit
MSTSAADNSQTHFIMTDKITTEELRDLAESTHPLHGDLVRVAKELLAENEVVLTILHQWEERCDKAEAERDALRAELAQLCGSIRDAYAAEVEEDQQSPIIDLVRHLIERIRAFRRQNTALANERDQQCAELERLRAERKSLSDALHASNEWPSHKGSMHITHNEHKNNYETVEEAIGKASDCATYDKSDFPDEDEIAKAISTDSVWKIQWYPDTPVGFCTVCASTFEAALVAAFGGGQS